MATVLAKVMPGPHALNWAADLVAVAAALSASVELTAGAPETGVVAGLLLTGLAGWSVASTALRHYDPLASRAAFDDVAMACVLVLSQVTILAVFAAATAMVQLSAVGALVVLLLPVTLALRLTLRPFLAREGPREEALVVGVGPLGRATAADLDRGVRQKVVGHLAFSGEEAPAGLRDPLLGGADHLEDVLDSIPVGEVYLAGNPARQGEQMQRAIKVCETLGVGFALPQYSFRFDRARPLESPEALGGYVHFSSVAVKPAQLALKRLFDIVVSAVALWLLLPLLAAVAAAIKLESRGPVLFRQLRVGLHGRTFHMYKFRSMVVDAERLRERLSAQNEVSGPVFKMKDDPRVTRVGRFIRKHSLDELPQILNVLRGDMSLVGPRPPLPFEVAQYQAWQRRRLSVRPGLTCIWQVSGRSQISFEEWMYLDMRYIDHWSLGGDVKLVLKTMPVVVNGKGAA